LPDNQSHKNNDKSQQQPIFLLPQPVMILIMVLIVVHIAFQFALDHDGQLQFWMWFGLIPARLVDPAIVGGMLPLIWTPITHALLHGSWTHLFVNVVWLAIFGTPVARRYGGFWFYSVFFIGAIGGALLYTLLQLNETGVLIGASGGVAGLTGAAMRFVFEPVQIIKQSLNEQPLSSQSSSGQARHDPARLYQDPNGQAQRGETIVLGRRLNSIRGVFSNSRARAFTLFWIGINLAIPVYDIFVGSSGPSIAWQAHIGGFAVGFLLPSLIERKRR